MFCEILENYSSFFIRKRVKIKLLNFLSCINYSCLSYCILGVAGRLLEESKKKKVENFFFFFLGFKVCKTGKKIIINIFGSIEDMKKKIVILQ